MRNWKKTEVSSYMTIYYRIVENQIEIVRCYGTDPVVVIPKQIQGLPVTNIAPYTFSDRKTKEEENVLMYKDETDELFKEQLRLLAGPYVEVIIFPDTVREIGNYIFYGCKNLKELSFSDSLVQIGSGAFTGCGMINKLNINMFSGKSSCAKEILGDLWQRIDIFFEYKKDKTKEKIVFPEHYEEAVENTPARILFTQHHGSGNDYRQCFYEKKLDYQKYDGLFAVATARDDIEVLTDLAFARLMYPQNLSEKAKQRYIEFIRQEYRDVLSHVIQADGMEQLKLISGYSAWTKESISYAIELSAMFNKVEISGYLMNEKQKTYRTNRKKFVL